MSKTTQEKSFRNKNTEGATIPQIKQQNHIIVAEEGTKGVSMTEAGIVFAPNSDIETEEKQIRLDKPFMYMVSQKSSNLVLFLGCENTLAK